MTTTKTRQLLENADAILITASNGLSISEGVNIFADNDSFKHYFGSIAAQGHFSCILQGAMGRDKMTPIIQKSFDRQLHAYLIDNYQPSPSFKALKRLVHGKNYFVVTSNADTHFQLNGFAPDRIWEIEGNFFGMHTQSAAWKKQQANYQQFIQQYANQRVVQLELGIGVNNRIIKAPMMEMVAAYPTWSYVTLNLPGQTKINPDISDRSIAISGDIRESLTKLANDQPLKEVTASKEQNSRQESDRLYERLVMEAQVNYSRYYGAYAQGGTPVKLTQRQPLPYKKQVKIFAQKIKDADHIIVGGASGLSAAGGGDFYYTDSPSFKKYFGKFERKYGIKGAFAGMRYPWSSREEYWGYLTTFLHTTLNAPMRRPYRDLQKLLKGKSYFILTTNQDTQAIKAFPEDHVAQIQGDHRFFQCSRQCTDDVWDATKQVNAMYDALGEGTKVPKDMIPRCPHCGAEAFPWVRGYGNFLEGKRYHQEYAKISRDLQQHAQDNKILFIELGVGRMTPMFIQEPFWTLTNSLPNAYDVMVNKEYQFLPQQIENKGQAIKGDIAQVLDDVVKELNK